MTKETVVEPEVLPPEDGTQETPDQRRDRLLKEAEEFDLAAKERRLQAAAIIDEQYAMKVQRIAQAITQLNLHLDDIREFIKLGKRPAVWPSKKIGTDAAPSTKKLKAKYFNPENPSETWSGTSSRPPKWALKYVTSPEGVLPRTFDPVIWIENKPA